MLLLLDAFELALDTFLMPPMPESVEDVLDSRHRKFLAWSDLSEVSAAVEDVGLLNAGCTGSCSGMSAPCCTPPDVCLFLILKLNLSLLTLN